MKKACFIFLFLVPVLMYAQERVYTDINNDGVFKTSINLLNESVENPVLEIRVNAYDLDPVMVNGTEAVIVDAPGMARLLDAGAPDLPLMAKSVVIPDMGSMTLIVKTSEYFDIQNVNVAPSKGNLLRNVNPDDVPYTYGSIYQQNVFFPSQIAVLKEPYIFRDLRGQTVAFYPFQYNAVTKVLRVYTRIVVELQHSTGAGINEFFRTKSLGSVQEEFHQMYSRHFLNYSSTVSKYTPVSEAPGKMLIISYGSFMADMQPFVDWKIMRGIQTQIVDVATIGNTAAAIKTYVQNYYNTNGLNFLLLVGDFAQVTSPTASLGGVVGAKDIEYAFVTGSDHYPEFLVGRFSAENVAHVQTQVARSVYYEKTPSTGGWYSKTFGMGSAEGPGDDNEYDYQHIRNIQTDLMGFTYTTKLEFFDGSQGGIDATGNPTPAMVSAAFNEGLGSAFYTGHGGETSWVTSGFSTTNVAALTNINTLPFIYTVSCVVGRFNSTTTCFCESWMRASQTAGPAGAVAIYGATINQSWNPPMEAQDEMVDILVESYASNIKRTFGGIGVNGCCKMLDTYNDVDMMDTWTVFGDPSIFVRTKAPMTMTVSHLASVPVGTTNFSVSCNVNGAYVALTRNNVILGTAYVTGGVANFTLPGTLAVGDHVTVCATEFNYTPYIGEFEIINNNIPNDAAATAISAPSGTYSCSGIQVTPEAVITNMGTNALTSCNVELKIDGSTVQTVNWTGNLATFGTATVSFNPVTIQVGTHTVLIKTSSPNGQTDGYIQNDEKTTTYTAQNNTIAAAFSASATSSCAAPLTVTFTNQSQNASTYMWDFGDGATATDIAPSHTYTSPGTYTVVLTADGGACGSDVETKTGYITVGADAPVASDIHTCPGNDAVFSATASGQISWYDAATAGNLVASGATYTIPGIISQTTLYAQNNTTGAVYNVGPVNNTTNGSIFTSSTEHYLIFDVTEACTLVSVSVNAQGAGNRTITLKNSAGTTLQTATVNIPDGVSRVTLNFSLTPGTSYRLCGQLVPNLYRSNAGLSYPYTINGVLSITGSSATTNPTGYYYYYYDWEVKMPDCTSGRTPVTAYVNGPSITMTTTQASSATTADGTATATPAGGQSPYTYLWSDGQTTQTATGLLPGTYDVTVTDNNGCSSTGTIVVDYLTGISEAETGTISVYPVPASSMLYITVPEGLVNAEMMDISGRLLNIKPVIQNQKLIYDVTGISGGICLLRLQFADRTETLRIMIE